MAQVETGGKTMPMPWEYDPVRQDGRGPVTRSDRARMALKFAFFVLGVVILKTITDGGEFRAGVAMGIGTALAGGSIVDLAWLSKGDFDHVMLDNRRQAIVLALALTAIGVTLLVAGITSR